MFEELKQRALRITEALYRTTDLFSDVEPLKWSLRQGALDILTSVSLLESSGYDKAHEVSKLEVFIKNIFLKLELAASGTFISKMNFEVLRREYGILLDNTVSIKDSYQKLLDSIASLDETTESGRVLDKKPVKVVAPANSAISDNADDAPAKSDKPAEPLAVAIGNGHRQEFILSSLKQKGQVGIGDLARALAGAGFGVSEKTVQRELNSLVASGAVKQEGEKRWRRYFI